ncbi:putative metal-binding protein (DUF2387) [Leptolyngbya sp. PCC 7375]|nr:putative metal-binding protein (DUF2387) [Leptolyngbya sp. PCC 7375]
MMSANESALVCPRCKEQGLVRLEHSKKDIFECVYCHHEVDLTQSSAKSSAKSSPSMVGLAFTAFLAALVVLIMIG